MDSRSEIVTSQLRMLLSKRRDGQTADPGRLACNDPDSLVDSNGLSREEDEVRNGQISAKLLLYEECRLDGAHTMAAYSYVERTSAQ